MKDLVIDSDLLLLDGFEADVPGSWGPKWATRGDVDVVGGVGRMVPVAGTDAKAKSVGVGVRDSVTRFSVAVEKLTKDSVYLKFAQREVGATRYETRLRFACDGSARLEQVALVDHHPRYLSSMLIDGVTVTPGKYINIEASAVGEGVTTLSATVWAEGTDKPSRPHSIVLDSSPELQQAGAVSLTTHLAGVATAPATVLVDNWITHQIPALSTDVGAVVRDRFSRVESFGWGAPDVGEAWSTWGATLVKDNSGQMVLKPGTGAGAQNRGVSLRDVEVTFRVTTDALPTDDLYTTVALRQAGSERYEVKLIMESSGKVRVDITAVGGGATKYILSKPLETVVIAGHPLNVKVAAAGEGTTTITLTMWPVGEADPKTPHVTVVDSTAALQRDGLVGVDTYLAGEAAEPVTLRFAECTIRDLSVE